MMVEVFDTLAPPRALLFGNAKQNLAVIVDGSSSWGTGREAADLARDRLAALWAGASAWSVSQLITDISHSVRLTPESVRNAELGWAFSVTALLCADDLVEVVAAGFYRVDLRRPDGNSVLFRPKMWVDELLATGVLSEETIADFPHRSVCLGPFLGDEGGVSLTTATHRLMPNELITVTHAARANAVLSPLATAPGSAAALAAMSAPDSAPSPVILVVG